MLLWLVNLDLAGGPAPVLPPLISGAIAISCPPAIEIQYEGDIIVPIAGNETVSIS
jgi:hypothetical protein